MLIAKEGYFVQHLCTTGRTPRDKEKKRGWRTFELGRLQENEVHPQCNY